MSPRKYISLLALACVLIAGASTAICEERFPPPEFTETGHVMPKTQTPPPRPIFYDIAEVAALGIALALASYLALKLRTRRGLVILSLASLAVFGFWRRGCVCPVGAIQNVAMALADSGYAIPATIVLMFLLPLVFTLVFGRTFCAAVCPLGVTQDLVALKPQKLPGWLNHSLGLLPWFFLGLAVLFAINGCGFIICRNDPFIAIFRLGGPARSVYLAAGFLLVGVFIARPYCRFVCPYGAMLRVASWLSKWHVKITPGDCVNCRLCEKACPFDAIDAPTPPDDGSRLRGKGRLALLLALLPVLVAVGVFAGYKAGRPMSQVSPLVQTYERLKLEIAGEVTGRTFATEAYRREGRSLEPDVIDVNLAALRSDFEFGAMLFGGFVGLVIALKLIALNVRRTRTNYSPNRATCLSCGRCFAACPVKAQPEETPEAGQ